MKMFRIVNVEDSWTFCVQTKPSSKLFGLVNGYSRDDDNIYVYLTPNQKELLPLIESYFDFLTKTKQWPVFLKNAKFSTLTNSMIEDAINHILSVEKSPFKAEKYDLKAIERENERMRHEWDYERDCWVNPDL